MLKNSQLWILSILGLTFLVSPVFAAEQSLDQRVARLERMANNPVLIQLSRQLGEQESEIQQLHDLVDRLNYQLKQMSDQQDKRYKESDDRLSQLEKQQADIQADNGDDASLGSPAQSSASTVQPASLAQTPVVASAPVVAAGSKASVVVPVPVVTKSKTPDKPSSAKNTTKTSVPVSSSIQTHSATKDENTAYQAAFSLMKASDYKGAAAAFNQFRQTYAQSSLASNASYWAGEAYLVLENPTAAIKAFQDVSSSYPTSTKSPAAMLRLGDTYSNQGNLKMAKETYQSLIQQFPKLKIAAKAKKRLADMSQAK